MILMYETDSLSNFVKDMHVSAMVGFGETTKDDDKVTVRKFIVEDADRISYEDLAEADSVFLVYVKKGLER